jgi:hypothetical protein
VGTGHLGLGGSGTVTRRNLFATWHVAQLK